MQLYHFILNPSLHTPSYIRRTSPFLSTVVAMTAAAYDSSSSGLAVPLERHAVYLSTRIVVQGYRSVEIVSGYCIWACVQSLKSAAVSALGTDFTTSFHSLPAPGCPRQPTPTGVYA